MNLSGEYLHAVRLGAPKNDIRLWFDLPFPGMQPGLVSEYSSPTPRQDPTGLAKCDHLPHGLILRTQTTTSSRPFSALRATQPGNERKGTPNVEEVDGDRQGVAGKVVQADLGSQSADILSSSDPR